MMDKKLFFRILVILGIHKYQNISEIEETAVVYIVVGKIEKISVRSYEKETPIKQPYSKLRNSSF